MDPYEEDGIERAKTMDPYEEEDIERAGFTDVAYCLRCGAFVYKKCGKCHNRTTNPFHLNHTCYSETEKEAGENDSTLTVSTYSLFPECLRCHRRNVAIIVMKWERLEKIYGTVISETLGYIAHPVMLSALIGMTILPNNQDSDEDLVTAVAGSLINLACHDCGMMPDRFVSLTNAFFCMILTIFSPKFTEMDDLRVEKIEKGKLRIYGRDRGVTVVSDCVRPDPDGVQLINSVSVLNFFHRTLKELVGNCMSPEQKKRHRSCHLYKALKIVERHKDFCKKKKRKAAPDEDKKCDIKKKKAC